MKFSKYDEHGAYHWKQYDQHTKYRRHAARVAKWVKGESVLDVGAGDGKITSLIGAKGIDNEPTAVRLAQEKGVDVSEGDAYKLPYRDSSFDSILMADVLEHFERPVDALVEARRVLRKFLYVTTPPKRPDGKLTDKYHYVEWTPEELQELVEKVGFSLEEKILSIPAEKVMYAKFRKLTKASTSIAPYSIFDPNYDADGNWYHRKFGFSLNIRRAIYHEKAWVDEDGDRQELAEEDQAMIDVTDILNGMIVNNRLAIPSNYNRIFGDPKRGRKKQLVIWFSHKGESGYTFVNEGTRIPDLVDYVKSREEAERQAEAEYYAGSRSSR